MPVTTIRGGRQITDGTVPYADIQSVTANTILGNNTAGATTIQEIALATNTVLGRGTGNISALTLGTGLTIAGTVLQPTANLQSLAGLNFASASFVRMTGAGTFSLDTNTYLTSAVTSVALASGTSGTDVNISGSPITGSGTITINIPSASATARGLVTTTNQTFAGQKLFQGEIILDNTGGIANYLSIKSGTGGYGYLTTGYISVTSSAADNLTVVFQAATKVANFVGTSLTAVRSYTLPNASGTLALTSDISTNYQAPLNGTGFVRMSGTTVSYITGTSSQFVKADGSLDSNTYLTSVSDVWVNTTGDSMTGNLSFGSSGAGITWAANTDGASITFESTGDGASGGRALSNLLIALTDNGDEGLKVTTTGTELLYVNTNQFQYKGSNVWTAANLTNLNQLTNGPGYITAAHTYFIGTTQNALNRSSAAQTLTGVSIDGDAGSVGGVAAARLVFGESSRRRGVNLVSNWNQTSFPDVAFLSSENNATNAPSGDYTYGLQYAFHRDGAAYRTQMVTSLYTDLNIWVRNSRDSDVWTAWKVLLHSGNFNSYAPTLTGTGASGTWAINVTGTAGSETLATVTGRGGTTSSGVALNGGLTVGNGTDLNLRAASGSDDSGDLVFQHGNGTELHRLWGGVNTLNFRANGGTTFQLIHTGNDTDFVRTRSTSISTNSTNFNTIVTAGTYEVSGNGTWTGSSNAPSLAYSYGQLVVTVNGNRVTQFYFTHATSGHWVRSKFNASDWVNWQMMWTNTNLTNLNQLTNGPGYITGESDTLSSVTGRGATTASQVSFTKTDDHAISVGTIRGRAVGSQTGDYIMMYERVHIGYPSGWGATAASAPTYGLGVWGNIHVSQGNATGGGIVLADDGDIVDLNDAWCSMRFTSGVRIYSANKGGSPVIALSNGGTITASGDVIAFGSPSDAKLKTIKGSVDNALEGIKKLNGYRFDWKNPDDLVGIKEDIGVIAQEVAEVFPELAKTNSNGNMSVRYQGLTAVLIEAVKEQQAQIEDLKKQIEFLAENR